jgi:hypothetical protein
MRQVGDVHRFHQHNKPYPPSTDGHYGDLEASYPKGELASGADAGNLSEHVALDRYVSTDQEDGSRSGDEDPNAEARRIPRWSDPAPLLVAQTPGRAFKNEKSGQFDTKL